MYTGGTIGMSHSDDGYIPVPNFLTEQVGNQPLLNDANYAHANDSHFVMPESSYGKRVMFKIAEYQPLVDSVNIDMTDWVRIASDIEANYEMFDAFIVLHGTDTMAYTASALSFMLQDLGKTVILTGSQIPMCVQRSDAISNLQTALILAGHFVIPEVSIFFGDKLFRGNRTSKMQAMDFGAFGSPNMDPLVEVGVQITVHWDDILRPKTLKRFSVETNMEFNVGVITLFPGMRGHQLRAFLQEPMKGVVLRSYGAGNAPTAPDITAAFKEAVDRGVVIVVISQCSSGSVTPLYASGVAMVQLGLTIGGDMTTECALAKLGYLLGKGYAPSKVRALMSSNLRGEVTIRQDRSNFLEGLSIMQKISETLKQDEDFGTVASSMGPLLLLSAVNCGELDPVRYMVEAVGVDTNVKDYDRRTPLHVACSEGHLHIAKYLIQHGASVHLADRWGHTPLYEAIRHMHDDCADLLVTTGASMNVSKRLLMELLRNAICDGDVDTLLRLRKCGADMKVVDFEGRNALHIAATIGSPECLAILLDCDEIDALATDACGRSALQEAWSSGHHSCARIIQEHLDANLQQSILSPSAAVTIANVTSVPEFIYEEHLSSPRTNDFP
jgi:60kDa lysophospholipase